MQKHRNAPADAFGGVRDMALLHTTSSVACYVMFCPARDYILVSVDAEGARSGTPIPSRHGVRVPSLIRSTACTAEKDDVLDNATFFWLTNTTISAARLYWEAATDKKTEFCGPKNVSIPLAASVFPDEVIPAPRSWTEWAYPNLIDYNQLDKGGHFAAWEQPKLLVEEMRGGSSHCANSRVGSF